MVPERLRILFLSMVPPSPARIGAQRRMEGLMRALSRRHEVSAVCYLEPPFDARVTSALMREYCSEVTLVPEDFPRGLKKRLYQARSLFDVYSYVRRQVVTRAFQRVLDGMLSRTGYHVLSVELPFMGHFRFRRGREAPLLFLDEHNIEFDLARQSAGEGLGLGRRLYNAVDWRKIRREEVGLWRRLDGTLFSSEVDRGRAREILPGIRSAVVPNSVDVDYFRPRPDDPPPDGRTLLFFGTQQYFPNLDGILHFLREIWPILSRRHADCRLKIVGADPVREVLAYRGPRVEVAGLVDDLRPHLASAAAVVVPIRVGGGTRFKVLEAMAMARPIVSTAVGAEGIDVTPGQDVLLADDPASFAEAVARLLEDPRLGSSLGAAGRLLVQGRYSWDAAARHWEAFVGDSLAERRARAGTSPRAARAAAS